MTEVRTDAQRLTKQYEALAICLTFCKTTNMHNYPQRSFFTQCASANIHFSWKSRLEHRQSKFALSGGLFNFDPHRPTSIPKAKWRHLDNFYMLDIKTQYLILKQLINLPGMYLTFSSTQYLYELNFKLNIFHWYVHILYNLWRLCVTLCSYVFSSSVGTSN